MGVIFDLAISLALSVLPRKVGSDLKDVPSGARVVDATGKLVMPGEAPCQATGAHCVTLSLSLSLQVV